MSKLDKFNWALHGERAAALLSELIGEEVTLKGLGELYALGALPARFQISCNLFKVNEKEQSADLNETPVFKTNEVLLSSNCSLVNDELAVTFADATGFYVAVPYGSDKPLDFFDPQFENLEVALFDTDDIYRIAEEANRPGPLASHGPPPASQTVFPVSGADPVILYADEIRAKMEMGRPVPEPAGREQTGQLLAIAGLLELLLEDGRPRYNQGSAAEEIDQRHNWFGASTSNLTKLFAAANRTAKDAEKAAQFRRETIKPRTR